MRQKFIRVTCNGCGVWEDVEPGQLAELGWVVSEGQDFCAACTYPPPDPHSRHWDEERPADEAEIDVWSTVKRAWVPCVYADDGLDGLLCWPEGDAAEIEEYAEMFPVWRPATGKAGAGEHAV